MICSNIFTAKHSWLFYPNDPEILLPLLLFLIHISTSTAQGTAQWRGPARSGVFPDSGLLQNWPVGGPKLCWYVQGIGNGYSSAVPAVQTLYVTGSRNDSDYLTAISDSGKIRWQVAYGASWEGAYSGAKCTPVSDGINVYVLSAYGIIICVDALSGKKVWTLDAGTKFRADPCVHGICESLLLFNDRLFYTPGGPLTTMVALDKVSGKTIWETESLQDQSSYTSPLLIRHTGKDIVITVTDHYLIGVDVSDGVILFRKKYSEMSQASNQRSYASSNAVTPIFHNGTIYFTGGYNFGGALFRLNENASDLEVIWSDSVLDCQMGGVVQVNGFIFGANWINNGKGNWCCLDWKTGKVMYEQNWFTKGAVIAAGCMLYCYEEKYGTIGLVRANPRQFDLVSSFRVPYGNGPHWAHPVIHKGILLIRHGDTVMAYDLRESEETTVSEAKNPVEPFLP